MRSKTFLSKPGVYPGPHAAWKPARLSSFHKRFQRAAGRRFDSTHHNRSISKHGISFGFGEYKCETVLNGVSQSPFKKDHRIYRRLPLELKALPRFLKSSSSEKQNLSSSKTPVALKLQVLLPNNRPSLLLTLKLSEMPVENILKLSNVNLRHIQTLKI